MYYYAYINTDNGFCYDVIESEEQMNDPLYIELSGLSDYYAYSKCYRARKIYENGEWRDATVQEAEAMHSTLVGENITIGNEWLDVAINNKAPLGHIHESYATTDHTHTASNVGAIAVGDIATVSEMETYLGI